MFSEEGQLVWAAHYRTWGAVKQIWQADNDNEAYTSPTPSPASLMRGGLAIRYDSVAEQSAHEAALDCPIRFQGQWEDAESGLYYNRHRYYDPLTASYLSPDPIGLAGGLRPNAYVHNPNSYIDPLGLAVKQLTKNDFPPVSKQVSRQKQERHIRDNPKHVHGGFLENVDDAQKVLDAYHSGEAVIIRTTRTGHPVVRYDDITGININEGAKIFNQPTNVFIIKGTKSPSVVPTNPN